MSKDLGTPLPKHAEPANAALEVIRRVSHNNEPGVSEVRLHCLVAELAASLEY